jgi:hypothetical protein
MIVTPWFGNLSKTAEGLNPEEVPEAFIEPAPMGPFHNVRKNRTLSIGFGRNAGPPLTQKNPAMSPDEIGKCPTPRGHQGETGLQVQSAATCQYGISPITCRFGSAFADFKADLAVILRYGPGDGRS